MASRINAVTSGGLISTADTSGILQLQTAGTAAVTVDASQNVGVGTASPTEKIHVAGALRVTGAQTTAGTGVYLQQASGTGGVSVYGPDNSTQGTFIVYSATANGGTGSTKATIDTSGNLGLGVTPSIYWGGNRGLDVGSPGCGLTSRQNNEINLCQNTAFNVYAVSGIPASRFGIGNNGAFVWNQAPAGTAGNTPTFTQAMTLDASGNLGIGTTSPQTPLDVISNASGYGISIRGRSSDNASQLRFASNNSGTIYASFDVSPTFLATFVNSAERTRIDSSGNLIVGTTATAGSERLRIYGSNANWIGRFENVNASPYGNLVQYSVTINGTGNEFLGCYEGGGATTRLTIRSNGGIANYSGNNVNLSDRREKTNFAPAKSYLDVICAIPVQTFNYIDQNMEEDGGLTLGVVAQDVQAVAPELVMESNWANRDDEPKMRLSIYQTDLQYALMKCIQEQQALIQSLKARLDAANL